MNHKVLFSHPAVKGSLAVDVNPNQIEWSYGLNTANYPTYGGEVVQILSCYIDDMTITGNVTNYRQMENIYRWFINYIHLATVGGGNTPGKFNVRPVTMFYKPRGWHFQIYPTSMPGFKYGRDVVAPEWTLTAAVVDPDQDFKDQILSQAAIKAINSQEGIQLFGKATANIGFNPNDPFSDPDAETKKAEKQLKDGKTSRDDLNEGFGELADFYNSLIPAYLKGNFNDLTADYSRPAPPGGVDPGTAKAKGVVKGNK